ncbi:peptide-methionine (S)-S-oxide reductase MsrA [Marinobacterium arenosum]|uniref:peptide-methionine (S)-S-oxide reductase MsrA n=1 Tax=Marinobacterium arenosum TaxID=2862496 RepID=UPI001C9564C7|nr:peptide-methionine (S)-S-oxide reductase MsrA [Marinobacterium arenosum]MBY4678951.1 peptide-methionine (S)-S-oxide reductase MsrA [Marinobacterium arenosum]
MQTATFAAGCFWGVEARFAAVPGVIETAVGYMGGSLNDPSYQEICTDRTGHAEVVQLTFDPNQVDYDSLLNTFWQAHDPTTLNRQGPDVGSQYRSAIFVHDDNQRALAEASKAAMDASGAFNAPIVTEIVDAASFWRAEEYHQKYLAKRGMGSCQI